MNLSARCLGVRARERGEVLVRCGEVHLYLGVVPVHTCNMRSVRA